MGIAAAAWAAAAAVGRPVLAAGDFAVGVTAAAVGGAGVQKGG